MPQKNPFGAGSNNHLSSFARNVSKFTTLADLFMCENVWCWNVPVVTIKKDEERKKKLKHSIIKIYVLWSQTDIKFLSPHEMFITLLAPKTRQKR